MEAPTDFLNPYPSCRHTHPVIDAALELRERLRQRGVASEEIQAVRVGSYPAALRITDNATPDSAYAAKFSLQFCVASALVHGHPSLSSFEGEHLRGRRVRDLASRSTAEVDAAIAARCLPAAVGCRGGALARAGGALEAGCEVARGDPESPLSDDDLDEKLLTLCEHGGLDLDEAEAMRSSSRALLKNGGPLQLPWTWGSKRGTAH